MKIVENNISVLPFYDSLDRQHHKKEYAYGAKYPLASYSNFLLPFQIVVVKEESDNVPNLKSVKKVALMNSRGVQVANLTNSMPGLDIKTHANSWVVRYPASLPTGATLSEGYYYLEITLTYTYEDWEGEEKEDDIVAYSELFNIRNDVSEFIKLEYRNEYDLVLDKGVIDFSDNFSFYYYFHTDIGKPEYVFEEEATERMGLSFVECQTSKKVYKFVTIAPEYMCDAMRIIRLCGSRTIKTKGGGEGGVEYDATSFEMEVKWEEQGDLASVECSFETDNVISTVGGFMPAVRRGAYDEKSFSEDYDIGI